MKGILVIAHGSRAKETERTLEQVVGMVKERLPNQLVQLCYMEFGSPNVNEGLTLLADQGCGEIVAVPYFLFQGVHIREDIPAEIKKFTDKNASIKVVLGKTLGADSRLADILADRIRESV